MKKLLIGICFAILMGGATSVYAQNACPPGLPPATTCAPVQDANGAFSLMAVPTNYNHRLMLWNHGGSLAAPAASSTDRGPLTIREALLEITAGKLNPTPLSITYDDMHGLWGGLTLTIRGDGNVEQKAVKEESRTPSHVSRDSILKLVRLLLKEKAWEQREPQRTPKPDESTARLVIQYDKQRSEIWEWYNDLDKNQRLGKIRDLMKTIASE
jgi:hypothetical protein